MHVFWLMNRQIWIKINKRLYEAKFRHEKAKKIEKTLVLNTVYFLLNKYIFVVAGIFQVTPNSLRLQTLRFMHSVKKTQCFLLNILNRGEIERETRSYCQRSRDSSVQARTNCFDSNPTHTWNPWSSWSRRWSPSRTHRHACPSPTRSRLWLSPLARQTPPSLGWGCRWSCNCANSVLRPMRTWQRKGHVTEAANTTNAAPQC